MTPEEIQEILGVEGNGGDILFKVLKLEDNLVMKALQGVS